MSQPRYATELSATCYAAVLAYWFSTFARTTSIEVFLVFAIADLVWFAAAYFTREWL